MMNRQTIIASSLVAVLGLAGVSHAVQTKETEVCGTTIEKASATFYKKVYKGVRACLLADQKCAGDQECIAKLLVLDKGKCAIGKLDEGLEYFGGGSASQTSEEHTSKIGKSYYKFVEKIGGKCFLPGVDLSDGPDGLGYLDPTPTTKFELAERLNEGDLDGVACSAHDALETEIPNRDALATELVWLRLA